MTDKDQVAEEMLKRGYICENENGVVQIKLDKELWSAPEYKKIKSILHDELNYHASFGVSVINSSGYIQTKEERENDRDEG